MSEVLALALVLGFVLAVFLFVVGFTTGVAASNMWRATGRALRGLLVRREIARPKETTSSRALTPPE